MQAHSEVSAAMGGTAAASEWLSEIARALDLVPEFYPFALFSLGSRY